MGYAEKRDLPSNEVLMDLDLWSIKKNREKACRILEALKGLSIQQAEELLKECGDFLHYLVIR